MTCPVCKMLFDLRRVDDVMRHYHDGPPIRIIDSDGKH